jgi:MFS family permease
VVQDYGWRWVFVAQALLIMIALFWCRRTLPDTDRKVGEPLDVRGALLLAAGVGALLLGINQVNRGWFSPVVLASLCVAAAAFPAFLMVERRAASPIFPLEWLGRREFTLPCLAAFALNFGYMGGFFMTPLFLEQGLHYSIGTTGFFQIVRPLVFGLTAPLAGYMAARVGERSTAASGAGVLVGSMLVFAFLEPGSEAALLIVLALAASGLANGLAQPSISAMVAGAVPTERLGSASGTMQVVSQVGVVAGIQVMETVQVAQQHSAGIVGSYHSAYWSGAVVAVFAVLTSLLIRPWRRYSWTLGRASTLGPEAAVEVG